MTVSDALNGLDRLLRPQNIAVIGGGAWCENVIAQCLKIGFAGEVWPVHPTREAVAGRMAVRSVNDLPAAPDAAFVGINRDQTIEVVRALSAGGAGGAVCFASGFREADSETGDGAEKEAALMDAAGDMTILGPNCYGFLNYLDGVALWPDQHGGERVPRGVALVTQSSNIALNLTMQARGLPVSHVVTIGNQAQTGLAEVCGALLRDERVTALGLYIEGIDDLAAFAAMAVDARAAGKAIVAIKTGRSDQSQAATISHTASLTGSDAGADALFDRLGIGRARSLSVLLETLKLLHVAGPLRSNRIASMSCSGGEACLMADAAFEHDVDFPPLDPVQEGGLRKALGPKVALANPLDYHTYIWGVETAMAETFTAMMAGDLAMGCVVLDFPRADRCDPRDWEPVISAVKRAKERTGRPMAIVSALPETLPEETAKRLVAAGIVPLSGLDDALAAISLAAGIGRAANAAQPVLVPPSGDATRVLSEVEAKRILATAGVQVPGSMTAENALGAAKAADRVGYPVVLKGQGIAHKTEAGAVVVGLDTSDAVEAAAKAMPASSFLVEEMIAGSVELLIGVVADPAHGYVLTLAAGGVLTEVMEDRVSLILPARREDVREALMRLRISRLIGGYRGQPKANIEAILDTVMAVQSYAERTRPHEVEINPLICGPDRAVAADALIRTGEENV